MHEQLQPTSPEHGSPEITPQPTNPETASPLELSYDPVFALDQLQVTNPQSIDMSTLQALDSSLNHFSPPATIERFKEHWKEVFANAHGYRIEGDVAYVFDNGKFDTISADEAKESGLPPLQPTSGNRELPVMDYRIVQVAKTLYGTT